MEPEALIRDLNREKQRIPLKKGTYQKLLKDIIRKEIYFYSKYAGIFVISLVAAHINVSRVADVAFHHIFMEFINFAIIYYLLFPDIKHIFQVMAGANILWCLAFVNMEKKCNICFLTFLFTVCSSFRWYGYTTALLQLWVKYVVSNYVLYISPWCQGAYFCSAVGLYFYRTLPFGFEDASLLFVVYTNVACYIGTHQLRNILEWEVVILLVTLTWMLMKSITVGEN